MHKKLEAELISLAHQILQMKNKDDVAQLRNKAKDVYEKLSVLTFVDNYFKTTPNAPEDKVFLLKKIANNFEGENLEKTVNKGVDTVKVVKEKSKSVKITKVEKPIEKFEKPVEASEKLVEKTVKTIKTEASDIVLKIQNQTPQKSVYEQVNKRKTLAEEMKDSIPADVAANMFKKANRLEKQFNQKAKSLSIPKVNIATKQVLATPVDAPKTSLNDRISQQKLQIGLNDRIAFVKHLFNFSQEDFNRVLSQLNSFQTEKECIDFINNKIKPDYNWNGKEEYETRLFTLIERKFL